MVSMGGGKAKGTFHEPSLRCHADFPVGLLAGWKTGATDAVRFMVPGRDFGIVEALSKNQLFVS